MFIYKKGGIMSNKQFKTETIAIHAGYTPDETNSCAIPLHRTASFVFKDATHASNLFALKELGNIYTRLTNPTNSALEQRVAELEGGAAAVSFASGTSAIYNTILNLAAKGDEIISSTHIYGGTFTMFNNILPEFGITTRFVNPTNIDNIAPLINEKTKAIFIETIGNPILTVLDIRAIADIAHKANIPLVVDATFTTPHIVKTIEHGADIVINSLTKWLGGHGTAIGGIVVDAGTFQWKDNPRFPQYNTPDESYNNLTWTKDIGALIPIAFAIRLRVILLRNVGACLSPDNAWIFLQGIETFALRIERHSQNALKTAEFLLTHPNVSSVHYPGLPQNASYKLATKYFKNNLYGGMIIIDVKGGREKTEQFIANLSLFSHLANVGDTKSLAIHPASTTHSQLTPEQIKESGISETYVRLSIGLEHIDDIIGDLQQALDTL